MFYLKGLMAQISDDAVTADDDIVAHRKKAFLPSAATAVSMSPDCSAVAAALIDGSVRFFSVWPDGSPVKMQCVQVLRAGDARNPISSIWFPDAEDGPEAAGAAFWRFLVVGLCGNTSLKVYECTDWKLEQTVRFTDEAAPFAIGLDPSAAAMALVSCTTPSLFLLGLDSNPGDGGIVNIEFVREVFLSLDILDLENEADVSFSPRWLSLGQPWLPTSRLMPRAEWRSSSWTSSN